MMIFFYYYQVAVDIRSKKFISAVFYYLFFEGACLRLIWRAVMMTKFLKKYLIAAEIFCFSL